MTFTLVRFGCEDISVDSDTIINFPVGVPGFENCHRFKLFHEEGRTNVFWLQSLDDPELAFSLTDPALLKLAYEVALDDKEQELLDFDDGDELQLAVILSRVAKDMGEQKSAVYALTRSPIVINIAKRLAIQKSIQEVEFTIRGR